MNSPPNNQAVGNLKDDVVILGVDQLSRGADFIPSPTKILKSLCDAPYVHGGINLVNEDIEDKVFDDEENKIFDSVLDAASLLHEILEAVKAKSSKRITENEFTQLFDIQEKMVDAFDEIKGKYLFAKLGSSERKTTEINPILDEMKKINERLTVLEGSLVVGGNLENNMNEKNDSPTPSVLQSSQIKPTWVPGKKMLAVSSAPIPEFPRIKSFQIYGANLFENSIIFENVLNVEQNDGEESLKINLLNLINERLNGILPSLERSCISRVTQIASKANSYLVSFNESFNAQVILDCGFKFSGSYLQPDERIYLYPLLSPFEREFQFDILRRFQKFQVKDDSTKKYNFRIYTCGYDLKVRTDEKVAFFNLSSGDVKEMIPDQKIKNFLIEEIGVSIIQ